MAEPRETDTGREDIPLKDLKAQEQGIKSLNKRIEKLMKQILAEQMNNNKHKHKIQFQNRQICVGPHRKTEVRKSGIRETKRQMKKKKKILVIFLIFH